MLRSISITLEMIKFQHTVFALPFAFLAAVTAAGGIPAGRTIVWILVAMVGARSAAMAFNRLADADIDAENPRTAGRALPAGLVSKRFVVFFTVVSIVLFIVASWMLNRLAFFLSPVALAVILGYSFTKRFTYASHFFLGLALGIAPVGAWIAVRDSIDPGILLLSASVLSWTAGFDILYSLQDLDFDRSRELFSIPARFGPVRAFALARSLHLLTVVGLVGFGLSFSFGTLYWVGVAAAIALLVWQHSIVSPNDLSRLDAAFFTANGVLSIILFIFGTADRIVAG